MQRFIVYCIVAFVSVSAPFSSGTAQDTNPLFSEGRVKNYLPHMSWYEVEQALKTTDMAIIPVGSIEQHGKHLPLCTDTYAAIERMKLLAQKTDVLVAPAVYAGLSEHHMGFPGTLTLSPATFEAVVFECAESLIRHGVRKIMIFNGHGGNSVSVANIIQRINQETEASAVSLNDIQVPDEQETEAIPFDWHAGVNETASMLYLTPGLVDMNLAEKPVLTLPEIVERVNRSGNENIQAVSSTFLFRPLSTGKKGSSREMSNIGVFTSGDPRTATAELGKKRIDAFIDAAVEFIEAWKAIDK
ncbi:creatininase family protein [candidate division KSB1 bacterium]